MIIPLPMHAWHPVAVHLPLVTLLIAAAFDLLAALRRSSRWRDAATTLWWAGLAGAAVAVTTGLLAFNRVDHSDRAHEVMTLHRNLAFLSLAFLVGAGIWRWRRPLAWGPAAIGVAGAIGLGVVGYLGGEIVYQHGLGISSQQIERILRERGGYGNMLTDSSAAVMVPITDSAAVIDSTGTTAPSTKKPHTHEPGREH